MQQREEAPRRSQHEPGAAPPEPAWLTAGLADALHLPRQPCRLPAPASLHPRLLALHLLAQGGQTLGQVLLRPGFHPLSPRLKRFTKMFAQFSQSASWMNEQCNSFVSVSCLTIWLLNMQHKIWLIQTTKKVQNQEVCTDLSLPQFGFKFGFLAALPLLYLHLLPLVSATSGKLQDSEVKFICRTVLEEIPFYEQQFKCCR